MSCQCSTETKAKVRRSINGKPTKSYDAWKNIHKRTSNPNHPQWADYGGRGIVCCQGLRDSFDLFVAVLGGEIPEGMTLDRTDNEGGYWCGQCEECEANGWLLNIRVATWTENIRNRRNTILVTYHGETLPLVEHVERLGLSYQTVRLRIKAGWDIEEALTIPAGQRRNNPIPSNN